MSTTTPCSNIILCGDGGDIVMLASTPLGLNRTCFLFSVMLIPKVKSFGIFNKQDGRKY